MSFGVMLGAKLRRVRDKLAAGITCLTALLPYDHLDCIHNADPIAI